MTGDSGRTPDEPNTGSDLSYDEAAEILRTLAGDVGCGSQGPPPFGQAEAWRDGLWAAERRPIETKLRLAETRYRTLIEQMPVVTFLAALDGSVNELYVSPQIELLLGFSQREWLENPVLWYTQLHPDDRQRWHEEFARTCAFGERFRSEYRFMARDGRVVWVHGEAQLVRDEAGRPLFLQGVAYDITEKKRAEEVLRRLNLELESRVQERTVELEKANAELARQAADLARSNAELEQFAYVASHDLQEPLRMVSSFTQLLASRYHGKLGPDADDFIGYVVDGAVRMQRLINDLLAYSRLGRTTPGLKATDCSAVVAAVCANLRSAIEESGADVTADPLPTVPAEESQLVQVFQNLIGNAVKFRKDGEPPRVHVGARRQNSEWLFWVRDNGIGIEPQYAERIFMVFQRLHNRKEHPGTGIGLAICKKVVEWHGGRIWTESEPGRGSTFYFSLPAPEESGHA
ncbi:MAG TPA: ATP-binding protein [Gemmataceae bacterium]|nr:ATP-binding protein [Gemmataceae bacterium]